MTQLWCCSAHRDEKHRLSVRHSVNELVFNTTDQDYRRKWHSEEARPSPTLYERGKCGTCIDRQIPQCSFIRDLLLVHQHCCCCWEESTPEILLPERNNMAASCLGPVVESILTQCVSDQHAAKKKCTEKCESSRRKKKSLAARCHHWEVLDHNMLLQ